MHLSTLLPLAATALLASANPALFPPLSSLFPPLFPANPVGSIVSTALATAPIPSAVVPVVSSAVAAAPAVPNNASTDSIPGLDIPPTELYNNILAAIAILDVVLTLLNATGLADVQIVKSRDLPLPISDIVELEGGGGMTATIKVFLGEAISLLSTEGDV